MALRSRLKKAKNVTPQDIRLLNLVVSLVLVVQAVIILVFCNSMRGSVPLVTNFLGRDVLASQSAGHTVSVPASHHIADINLAYIVAAFLIAGAIVHILVATRYRFGYEQDLKSRFNKARWIDYCFSLGMILVSIAILSGVYDISSLIMILALSSVLGLMGLMTEKYSDNLKDTKWMPYIEAVIFGLVPCLVILIYGWGAHAYGNALPTYVYWLFASTFLMFGALFVNLYLQMKKIGHWENYHFSERTFILLGAGIKTAVAWQIFFGTLR